MQYSELSRIMHVARVLQENKPCFPFKDHLRLAWYHWYFHRALQRGICTFSYFKGNPADYEGSRPIRQATGTLNMALIPLDKRPKDDHPLNTKPSYTACAYFDLEKGEWRSYRYVDFIGYVTFLELKEGFFISQKKGHNDERMNE